MDLECTSCRTRMTRTRGAGGNDYHSCPSCARTFASVFHDPIRRRAGVRPVAPPPSPRTTAASDERFAEVKKRLDAWMRRIDGHDPWRVLGVEPGTPAERIRQRFRELAFAHHPDRGGDPAEMRRVSRAWEELKPRLAAEGVAPAATARAPKVRQAAARR